MTRKIFAAGLVAISTAITLTMIEVQGKKNAFTATVTEGAGAAFEVADEGGKLKKFADAGAAVKFVSKFCTMDTEITVETEAGQYAPTTSAGDPVAALAREISHIDAQVIKANLLVTGLTADIAAMVALHWDTGSTAQQEKVVETNLQKTLLSAMVVTLLARKTVLQG